MDNKQRTLQELKSRKPEAARRRALVGIDGFIDKIVHPVDKRIGHGCDYKAIPTISAFAKRIGSAAGKSANIELYPVVEKIGGNGPIMANAQLALGTEVRYLGALGKESIAPVFTHFAERTKAVSITDPGITHAAEFNDGKILFGSMASLDEITYERIIEVMGEEALVRAIERADLLAMVNWTMVPHLTSVFQAILDHALPKVADGKERGFFFDLADPEKRSDDDLREVLETFGRFERFGRVTLGLNLREAEQVDKLLGFDEVEPTPENLKELAARIREHLKLSTVVVHPTNGAACACNEGRFYAEGPYCESPKITTGAGDHFNAGFVTARMIGLSPEAALTVAVTTSGYYVRNAESPSLDDIESFIRDW